MLAFIHAKFDCKFIQFFVPVFIMGFDCKGCVIDRESVKTQANEFRRFLEGISRVIIPRSETCALRMTGMRRVNIDGDSCVSRVARS